MDLLIIDDEASLRRTLRTALESMGHHVAEAGPRASPGPCSRQQHFDLAFLDLRLGREVGMDLLPRTAAQRSDTGRRRHHGLRHHRHGGRGHAARRFDYLPKPFTPDQIRVVLDRWRAGAAAAATGGQPRRAGARGDAGSRSGHGGAGDAAGAGVAFQVAASEATVLLRGESGTGKGVLARAIHERSPRQRPLRRRSIVPACPANCWRASCSAMSAARSPERCATPRARSAAAEGGTLFLDEIGDLPLTVQPKLLRLLQEEATSASAKREHGSRNVRILAATNRDLEAEVAAGRFREDLFYRLNVIEIELPPLRQRPRRHLAAGRASAATSSPGRPARRVRLHGRGARRRFGDTTGPATSASCATPSSAA